MSLKVPDVGCIASNDDQLAARTFTVHLYKNNYTPVAGSVLGSFTEADFNGYAAQVTTWAPSVMIGGRAVAGAPVLIWTKGVGGVGNSIYGYYVTDNLGRLRWAERDPAAPRDMNTDGSTYLVGPSFSTKSEF